MTTFDKQKYDNEKVTIDYIRNCVQLFCHVKI